VIVLVKSPPIPTKVYTLYFHVATYVQASESVAVFTHSTDLDETAKELHGDWQCRRWMGESRAET